MADKTAEELLAAHKAMVAAMSPKQRTAYYDQITADQIEYARANPYKGGPRQAQAEMPKGIAAVAETGTSTAAVSEVFNGFQNRASDAIKSIMEGNQLCE